MQTWSSPSKLVARLTPLLGQALLLPRYRQHFLGRRRRLALTLRSPTLSQPASMVPIVSLPVS